MNTAGVSSPKCLRVAGAGEACAGEHRPRRQASLLGGARLQRAALTHHPEQEDLRVCARACAYVCIRLRLYFVSACRSACRSSSRCVHVGMYARLYACMYSFMHTRIQTFNVPVLSDYKDYGKARKPSE